MLRLAQAAEATAPRDHVVNILVAEAAVRRLACRALRFGSLAPGIAVLVADLDIAGTAAGTSAATVIEMTPATDRAA